LKCEEADLPRGKKRTGRLPFRVNPIASFPAMNLKRVGRIMIRRYESKMAGYAFGSNPPYALIVTKSCSAAK
jgi:hypothetical protein